MAHYTVRTYQSKSGLKWTLTEVQWVSGENRKKERAIKSDEAVFHDLGFSVNMTPKQARSHAKKLTALSKQKRKEQAKKVRASENLYDLVVVQNSIIPEELSNLFVDYIKDNWFGGDYNLRKQILHWNKVQKILTKLKLHPHEYFKRRKEVYRYFINNAISMSYIEKLLKVMNQWGEFYSEQTKSYFKKIPLPTGVIREQVKENSNATGRGSDPLTPEILNHIKDKMPEGQWEYLRATLWLGLRPSELDAIIEDKDKYLAQERQGGIKIVGIYQAKLTGVSKDMRWKWVPIIHKEQQAALKDINQGKLSKPLVKTIKRYASTDSGNLGLYSGRKGFTDLMLDLDQKLEDISQWLGHASIERTWRHYKDKKRVSYTSGSGLLG